MRKGVELQELKQVGESKQFFLSVHRAVFIRFDIQAGLQSTFDDIEDVMDLCH